jgi:hypothetical protein
MFYLIALHAMIFMTVVVSTMGTIYILKGSQIFDLKISTRNFMYVGACTAMCFGFLGATVCINSSVTTLWHYVAATILCIIGVFATAHISVDLSDRLRILKRDRALESTQRALH